MTYLKYYCQKKIKIFFMLNNIQNLIALYYLISFFYFKTRENCYC